MAPIYHSNRSHPPLATARGGYRGMSPNTLTSAYTHLETLLLFQTILQRGISVQAFFDVSELLKRNIFVKDSPTFDPSRLSPDALQNAFQSLLPHELKSLTALEASKSDGNGHSDGSGSNNSNSSNSSNNSNIDNVHRNKSGGGTGSDGVTERAGPTGNGANHRLSSPNMRKHKLPAIAALSISTLEEAQKHADKLPAVVHRLYIRYRDSLAREIQQDESSINTLRKEIVEIQKGEWDERIRKDEATRIPSGNGTSVVNPAFGGLHQMPSHTHSAQHMMRQQGPSLAAAPLQQQSRIQAPQHSPQLLNGPPRTSASPVLRQSPIVPPRSLPADRRSSLASSPAQGSVPSPVTSLPAIASPKIPSGTPTPTSISSPIIPRAAPAIPPQQVQSQIQPPQTQLNTSPQKPLTPSTTQGHSQTVPTPVATHLATVKPTDHSSASKQQYVHYNGLQPMTQPTTQAPPSSSPVPHHGPQPVSQVPRPLSQPAQPPSVPKAAHKKSPQVAPLQPSPNASDSQPRPSPAQMAVSQNCGPHPTTQTTTAQSPPKPRASPMVQPPPISHSLSPSLQPPQIQQQVAQPPHVTQQAGPRHSGHCRPSVQSGPYPLQNQHVSSQQASATQPPYHSVPKLPASKIGPPQPLAPVLKPPGTPSSYAQAQVGSTPLLPSETSKQHELSPAGTRPMTQNTQAPSQAGKAFQWQPVVTGNPPLGRHPGPQTPHTQMAQQIQQQDYGGHPYLKTTQQGAKSPVLSNAASNTPRLQAPGPAPMGPSGPAISTSSTPGSVLAAPAPQSPVQPIQGHHIQHPPSQISTTSSPATSQARLAPPQQLHSTSGQHAAQQYYQHGYPPAPTVRPSNPQRQISQANSASSPYPQFPVNQAQTTSVQSPVQPPAAVGGFPPPTTPAQTAPHPATHPSPATSQIRAEARSGPLSSRTPAPTTPVASTPPIASQTIHSLPGTTSPFPRPMGSLPDHLRTDTTPGPSHQPTQFHSLPQTPQSRLSAPTLLGTGAGTKWTLQATPGTPRPESGMIAAPPSVPLSPVMSRTKDTAQKSGTSVKKISKAPAALEHSRDMPAQNTKDTNQQRATSQSNDHEKAEDKVTACEDFEMATDSVRKTHQDSSKVGTCSPARRPSRGAQRGCPVALAVTARTVRSRSVVSQGERSSSCVPDIGSACIKEEASTPKMPDDTDDTTAENGQLQPVTPSRAPSQRVSRLGKRKRPQSPSQTPTVLSIPSVPPSHVLWTRGFQKASAPVLDQISSHKDANMFANAVKKRDAPRYSDIVRHPQDLKNIRSAITMGNRAATQALNELAGVDPNSPQVWLPWDESLVPPRGIINTEQLECELVHMFANAVMYNLDPFRGPGRAFRKVYEQQNKTNVLGYMHVPDAVVKNTRNMYLDVEKLLSELRSAEKDRPSLPAGATGIFTDAELAAARESLRQSRAQSRVDTEGPGDSVPPPGTDLCRTTEIEEDDQLDGRNRRDFTRKNEQKKLEGHAKEKEKHNQQHDGEGEYQTATDVEWNGSGGGTGRRKRRRKH